MKNLLFFLFAFVVLSCNGKKAIYTLDQSQPIVDYNQSYESHDQNITVNKAFKRYNEQTVILFNGKLISEKELTTQLDNKKVKSIENVTDSTKIEELGYDFDKVKRIIAVKS